MHMLFIVQNIFLSTKSYFLSQEVFFPVIFLFQRSVIFVLLLIHKGIIISMAAPEESAAGAPPPPP